MLSRFGAVRLSVSLIQKRYVSLFQYSWDRNLFPDPTEFTRWLHEERNLSLLLNLHDAYVN